MVGDTGLEPVTPACKAGALPTELIAHIRFFVLVVERFKMVELSRIELLTSCVQGRRSPS